jgi:hypothetical protein
MAAPKGVVYTELGVTGLNRFGGAIAEDYLADWNSLPRMVKLVRRMMDHPVVSAATFAVEMLAKSAKVDVEPASEEPQDVEASEFLESCLDDMSHSWTEHMGQAITMAWYGFAPFEIVYKRRLGPDRDAASKYDDGRIGWRKFGYRSPDTLTPGSEWVIDENGGVQGMNQTPPAGGKSVFIPIEKMLLYRTSALKNNPQGKSALRGAYLPWYFSKNFSEIEGIAAERMGTGMPVMYLGRGTKLQGENSDFSKAQDIVRNTRTDEQMGIVIPYPKMTSDGQGALFELVSPGSRGMIDFGEAITRYNQQIAQVLLAQFIFFGLSERGTQALAVRATDFFAQAVSGWLDLIADTLNRFGVERLFKLNAGAFGALTDYPRIVFAPLGQQDVAALVGAVAEAVKADVVQIDAGLERTVRQLLELPELEKGTIRKKPAPPVPFGPGGILQRPKEQPAKDGGHNDPALDVAEGGETPEDEAFAASRFRGSGAARRRTWERETNNYQAQLGLIYGEWLNQLADDIEEDPESSEDTIDEALSVLATALAAAGRENIIKGSQLGLGGRTPSADSLMALARRLAENEEYLDTSLIPDTRRRLLIALSDPDVKAAGAIGIVGYMAALQARVESYAGQMWTAIQDGAGWAARDAEREGGGAVAWVLDDSANHCSECPDAEGEYASMDELLEATGGRLPGDMECEGNCRCWLEIDDGSGSLARP